MTVLLNFSLTFFLRLLSCNLFPFNIMLEWIHLDENHVNKYLNLTFRSVGLIRELVESDIDTVYPVIED